MRDTSSAVTTEENKQVVSRLIDEVINGGDLDAVAELCDAAIADGARGWIAPFREAFPDVHMETVDLVAEGERVAGRFKCSATHTGSWGGNPPSGRRFEDVDEVYFFSVREGRITEMWGLEDTISRIRQLGIGAAT